MIEDLRGEIEKLADKKRAALLQRYFKTGKGEYAEGDIFVGLTVPQSRTIAKKFKEISFAEIDELLRSPIHEERLIALLILVHNFRQKPPERKKIYGFYLKNTKHINNWDLVDLSSHAIVGAYLADKPKNVLLKLAKSKDLWEKRIAVISTFAFIKDNDFETSLAIAEILIDDKTDLIQKAVGWMLREIGKKNLEVEEEFLKKYCQAMGRTALRYAIEKFSVHKRQHYLYIS